MKKLLLCFIIFFIFSLVAQADESLTTLNALDLSFGGGDGIAALPEGNARVMVRDSENRILIAGTLSQPSTNIDFFLTRLLPDGTLDESFGIDGITARGITNSTDTPTDMAIHPNGKIIIAGKCGSTVCVTRFDPLTNNWDTAFEKKFYPPTGNSFNQHVALGFSLSHIILAGTITSNPLSLDSYNSDFFFYKLDANGNDIGFNGSPGMVRHDINNRNDTLADIFVSPYGITAFGHSHFGTLAEYLGDPDANGDTDMIIVLMNVTSGNLITSFANNGILRIEKSGTAELAVTLHRPTDLSDYFFLGRSDLDLLVGKLTTNPSLSLDTSFGNGAGYVTMQSFDMTTGGQDLKIDNQNRIIVKAGRGLPPAMVVTRLSKTTGDIDEGFGNCGFVIHEDYRTSGQTLLLSEDYSQILVGSLNNPDGDGFSVLAFANPVESNWEACSTVVEPPADDDEDAIIDDPIPDDPPPADLACVGGLPNSIVETGEVCDDGNNIDDDACFNNCQENPDFSEGVKETGGGGCNCYLGNRPVKSRTSYLVLIGLAILGILILRQKVARKF